tara:strand:+ start:4234 stop:4713 length:480 start_codon:yes stop_codon:yes gene_type:complete
MKWEYILKKKPDGSGYGEEGTKEWFQTALPGQLAYDDWTLPGTHPLHERNREYSDYTEQEIIDMMDRIKGVKAVDYVPTEEDMEKYKELAAELEFRRSDEEDWRSSLLSPQFARREDYTQGSEQWTEERLKPVEIQSAKDYLDENPPEGKPKKKKEEDE